MLGVAHCDEKMQKLFEALCRDGKTLCCDDEKETSSGTSKEPMNEKMTWLKIEWTQWDKKCAKLEMWFFEVKVETIMM